MALEAGILPLSASKYAFRIGPHQLFNAIMWPDPYEYNTACMVTQTPGNGRQASFVRITENRASYSLEGVALGLTYGVAASLYGRQLILRHDLEEGMSMTEVGARFIIAATESAQEITAKPALPPALVKPEMVGIEGGVTARLFRSLGSFGANLAVSGAIGERGMFSERTYDLAHALLKMTIVGIANNPNNEAEDLLVAPSGRPFGAVFASERDGILVVRRGANFPDTIALATAGKPRAGDDTLLVEQHLIQARGVGVDMMTLPAEAYSPQGIVGALPLVGVNPRKTEPDIHVELDEAGCRALDQKIMRILAERVNQTV